jgi:hypothetical protein
MFNSELEHNYCVERGNLKSQLTQSRRLLLKLNMKRFHSVRRSFVEIFKTFHREHKDFHNVRKDVIKLKGTKSNGEGHQTRLKKKKREGHTTNILRAEEGSRGTIAASN